VKQIRRRTLLFMLCHTRSSIDRPRRRISNLILWTTVVVSLISNTHHWLFGGATVAVVVRRWSNSNHTKASAFDPFVPQITNYWHSICISPAKNNQLSQRKQKRRRMTPFVIVATAAATTTAAGDTHHCPPPPPPEESLHHHHHRWEDYQSRAIAQCILPLLSSEHSHKGSSGRIVIMGGSAIYTGAPYFAGMAALRIGADLVSVCTAQEAVVPLKCYSPDLMVQSVYDTLQFQEIEENSYLHQEDTGLLPQPMSAMLSDVTRHFQEKRIHCVVIGPGMGRHPVVLNVVARIITVARQRGMYIVLDADALYLLSLRRYRYLLQGYDRAVITPNAMEYQRLMNDDEYRKLDNDNDDECAYMGGDEHSGDPLDAVTIVQKGYIDTIWRNGQVQWKCGETGGMKRAGGIGDVLAGTIGTMVAWQSIVNDRAKEEEEVVVVPVNDSVAATTDTTTTTNPVPVIAEVDLPLACWTACCVVKRATKRAFDIKLRSMSAQDVLDHLGPTMEDMIQ
jgi:ATP-dependent NAD(P)H-hydrate dehydratase